MKEIFNEIIDWFITNPVILAISLLVGLMSLILSIIFYIRGKKNKDPRYGLRSFVLINDFNNHFKSVNITSNGNKISNLTVTRLVFFNNGKETLDKSDFAQNDPFRIELKNNSKVIECNFIYRKNEANNFIFSVSPDQAKISMNFDYLDYTDGIILQILHTGLPRDIKVMGMFKGAGHPKRLSFLPAWLKRIMEIKDYLKFSKSIDRYIAIIGLLIIPIVFFALPFFADIRKTIPVWFSIIMGLISASLYWPLVYYFMKSRLPKDYYLFDDDPGFK
jgi:hypothetical protein